MPDEPREAEHDFAVNLRHDWKHRDDEGDDQDVVLVLRSLEGQQVTLYLRDGSQLTGVVRTHGVAHDVPNPDIVGGRVTLGPDDRQVDLDDIVAVAPLPDPTMSHNSEPPGTEDI
jgi:hypothetical protein